MVEPMNEVMGPQPARVQSLSLTHERVVAPMHRVMGQQPQGMSLEELQLVLEQQRREVEVMIAARDSGFRSEVSRLQQALDETRSRMALVQEPAYHQPLQRVRGHEIITPYFGGGMTTPQPPRTDRDQRPTALDPFRQVAIGGTMEDLVHAPSETTAATVHSPALHRDCT